MATTWSEASGSVISTAQELIDQHHQNLKDLRIGFIFRSEAAVSQGKYILAKISKVPEKLKLLLELDVLIWIAEDEWGKLASEQRKALIDHELCHIFYSPGDLRIVGHDIEEFQQIIEWYGLWNQDLLRSANAFKDAGKQLELGLEPVGKVIAVGPDMMQLSQAPAEQFITDERG